jgi:aspartyl-tRNA(Asn)/glutamyl-tRNA(Gln) amidotransferase subunit A
VAIVTDTVFSDANDAVIASLEEAQSRLRRAGHDVVVTKSPTELSACLNWHRIALEYELSRIHGALETTHPEQISAAWLAAIIRGKKIEDADYFNARHQLLQAQTVFWNAWANVDVLIAPAAPDTAPEGQQTGDPRYIIPFTALGGPIATVPVGLAPIRLTPRSYALRQTGQRCGPARQRAATGQSRRDATLSERRWLVLKAVGAKDASQQA